MIALQGGGANPDLVEDIIANALKLLTDVKDRGDARVIRTAVRELRYAFRLFAPYRDTRKVTIFGSARTAAGAGGNTGRRWNSRGRWRRRIMVITGAGPGIMQAGHEGAGRNGVLGRTSGCPGNRRRNPIIDKDEKLIHFKYFSRAS